MNCLESLKQYTTVSADTADIEKVRSLGIEHCTTNPSIILKAATMPEYQALVTSAISWARKKYSDDQLLIQASRYLGVLFGVELSKVVSGYVFTQVTPSSSFDVNQTLAEAREMVNWYRELGVPRERVQVKIAATWSGIEAARVLETEGVRCTMTLLFSFAQAVASAEAGVSMIAPYVGRIMDWYKLHDPRDYDPGVASVAKIYRYFKTYGYQTQLLAASFRSVEEIEELCGCDYLTIPLSYLDPLQEKKGELTPRLTVDQKSEVEKITVDESAFHWAHIQDPMTTEKLAEGMRLFHNDVIKLEGFIQGQI